MFPFMSKKITPPPKMAADHQSLLVALNELDSAIKAVKPGGIDGASFSALATKFEIMQKDMLEHFAEEESVGLPLLRHNFSQKGATHRSASAPDI